MTVTNREAMNWQSIEVYDAMEVKPKFAVFLFAGVRSNRENQGDWYLPPRLELNRNFGFRNCTHFCEFPEPPK